MPILQFSPILCFSKTTEMGDGGRVSGNLKLWGRMVAEIEPEWIEPLAEHLIKNPIQNRVGRNPVAL